MNALDVRFWRDQYTDRWYASVGGRILLTSGYATRLDAVSAAATAVRIYGAQEVRS